ncbi:hypothetical protein AYO45_05495 [Gammaproteobacteria bacterium SCGC AG-212-F23]|nr:hypothetical protein AYO45_05495 [Gammaproteobacteria bacterium SCGC AG-212-F23]
MIEKTLDYFRIALYVALVAVALSLFQFWQQEHQTATTHVTTNTSTTYKTDSNYIPEITNTISQTTAEDAQKQKDIATKTPVIHITTDLVDVAIDTTGGNITGIKLLKFPETLHSTQPYLLLNNNAETRYLAQSGLLGDAGPDTSKGQAVFTSENTQYTLQNNQNELQVSLHWQNNQGVRVTKIYTLHRNSYEIDLNYLIENQGNAAWNGNLYLQLLRTNTPPKNGNSGFVNLATYFGAAISTPEKPFKKITFKDMVEKPVNESVPGGWAAMVQHYFISAWVPEKNTTSQYFSRVTNDGLYTIGMIGPAITVKPGEKTTTSAKLYSGPAVTDTLEKVAPGLQLTIDYGWFWFISIIIFWMMQKIYDVVGNWGWSIVFVTLIIKLMFYHLSAKSYRSMSAMKKLQPKINELKERFGADKQKFTQATLELYKKEKVNPMSGCLPILVQIPVFIGLYWVLIESVQLRQAPFIFWIHDLSTKDPFYILPVLMGLSMFLQQRLNPPPPDPMQAKLMMLMPVIFTAMFMNFPAGLMLYWFVNNTLSFLQQWYIMHSMEKSKIKSSNK